MYSLNYKVTTSTCDSEGKLKLYSALQMMQDCSEMWIDSEPGVKDYFLQQNMAQLLATRQVEIIRVPDYKEELTVTTSVYGMKPMFGFRNTFIYDAQGNPCYKTWSMGAFVDKAAGKLKRVDDATIQSMKLEPQLEMNYKDRRIILPKGRSSENHPSLIEDGRVATELDKVKTEGEVLEPIKVLRADIDYNKHLNNANYVRMAMELLPEDFVVSGLRVEYRVAAKLGDCLTPTIYKIADGIIVSLSIGSEVSAIIEFRHEDYRVRLEGHDGQQPDE
jgi:acyl-ACP thioesterase